MTQTLTFLSPFVTAFTRFFNRDRVRVLIRLDRSAPGAHLIWDIENAGTRPVTITRLVIRGGRDVADAVPLELPRVLMPQDRLVVPTDVEWGLLAARSVAVADANGLEHAAPRRQLRAVREQVRQLIDRRASHTSAREFLFGAADLAFGVVILGLGFFMLMWVIATG